MLSHLLAEERNGGRGMRVSILGLATVISLIFTSNLVMASDEISQEELERWFNTDSMEPPRYKEVNDGHLVFLVDNHDKKLHHHHNSLTIYPNSLQDGWVQLEQCHSNIDKVAAAQILFKEGRVKDIKITQQKNIDRAWVEKASVQMEDIKENAVLCIQANSHSLIHNVDGTFSLRNGPFMRRFLDGYYPIRVSLDLNFSQTNLELTDFEPQNQNGFQVVLNSGKVHVDTVFEGKLQTEFHFKDKNL